MRMDIVCSTVHSFVIQLTKNICLLSLNFYIVTAASMVAAIRYFAVRAGVTLVPWVKSCNGWVWTTVDNRLFLDTSAA